MEVEGVLVEEQEVSEQCVGGSRGRNITMTNVVMQQILVPNTLTAAFTFLLFEV